MRTTLTVAATLVALAVVGCGTESPVTTAPVAPVSQDTQVRAVTDIERAIELQAAEMAGGNAGGIVQSAISACQFDVPADVFGTDTPVENRLFFVSMKNAEGEVSGMFSYTQAFNGDEFIFSGRITCLELYDFDGGTKNRAKLGGPIDQSNDPTIPVGTYIWWQTIDNQKSPGNEPDKSTLSGFGDEAANAAFCVNPAPPRFGPWLVHAGNIHIREHKELIAATP